MHKKYLITLISIFVLALILRTWQIQSFPVGITHDELDYVMNSKSIFHTGKGLDGEWSPLSLTAMKSGSVMAELTSLLMSPFQGLTTSSLATARLPYAVSGSLLAVVIYLFVSKLINQKAGLMAAFMMAISPWGIHFSRTAYESPVSTLFFFLSFYLVLKLKHWKILLAFPTCFLAFFTYHGSKVVFLPFIIIILAYKLWIHHKSKQFSYKPYIAFMTQSIVTVLYFVISLNYQAAGERTDEFFINENSSSSQTVDDDRRLSIPNQLTPLFINKYKYFIETFIQKYFQAFSPQYLFLFGDRTGVGAFSYWSHGLLYYLDAVFILMGLYYLFRKKYKVGVLTLLLLLTAPLTGALHSSGVSFVLRGTILFPLLVILSSIGIYSISELKLSKKIYTRFVLGLIAVCYLFLFTNYLHLYFVRYPVFGSDGFFLSTRVLSSYINRLIAQNPDQRIYIVHQEPYYLYKEHLFYSQKFDTKQDIQKHVTNLKQSQYQDGNVEFTSSCPNSQLLSGNAVLIKGVQIEKCQTIDNLSPEATHLSISSLVDTGQLFHIYGDSLCQNLQLKTYPRIQSSDDFNINNSSNQGFCSMWISDLS